jgi:ABC-type nitrate/sulfonate/bicarbonate transport system substrate-binding protein
LETDVKIRLMENFRALFYAPYYATHALGFYANEGVDVELVSSDAPGDAPRLELPFGWLPAALAGF